MESIDVCFTFDTTGSMYPCLGQVKKTIKHASERLFKDIPDLRIAVIAHGDYCDAGDTYVTKVMDFSSNVGDITNFVTKVGPTFGGDAPECYELALHEARTKLSWQSGRAKVIVMIGDDIPHGPTYPLNTLKIDWRNELGLLLESNINVYGVHAMPGIRKHSKPFYEEIAQKTGGFYLTLEQFSSITSLIMAICYKQSGEEQLNQYVEEVKSQGLMTREFATSIRAMSDIEIEEESVAPKGLNPVPAGRFQVLSVDEDESIRDFIKGQDITFKQGRGFYQLSKAEKVQQYKEVVLMDKSSGDIYHGAEARSMLGLSPQCEKGKGALTETLKNAHLDGYNVFIQSTSYGRKLKAGTSLLYEVDDWDRYL